MKEVYNMEIHVWETSTGVCCKNTLMFLQFTKESKSNWSVRVWLEKRKEVWVALHTFCKLLKTVVERASVKPTVNLELTLLFLSKLTFSFSLTSSPLQRGLYIKQRSPTHNSPQEKQGQNSTLNKGGSVWIIIMNQSMAWGSRWHRKKPCAKIRLLLMASQHFGIL